MSDTTITRARLVTAVSALVLVAGGVASGSRNLARPRLPIKRHPQPRRRRSSTGMIR